MEVTTVQEQSSSRRAVLLYCLTTSIFVVGVLAPVYFSVPYLRVLKTVVLLVVVAQVGRLFVSALVSIPASHATPSFPSDDDELPTVSVVIPVYNEASVLEGTIDACRAVDYPEHKLEVVVCYEADSTDETAAIARRANRRGRTRRTGRRKGEGDELRAHLRDRRDNREHRRR